MGADILEHSLAGSSPSKRAAARERPVEGSPLVDRDAPYPPEAPGADPLARRANRRVEAPRVVDREHDAGGVGRSKQPLGLVQRRRERLLAQHGDACPQKLHGDFRVKLLGDGDDRRVRLAKHLPVVRSGPARPELLLCGGDPAGIGVHHDQTVRHARDGGERRKVKRPGDGATPHDRDPHRARSGAGAGARLSGPRGWCGGDQSRMRHFTLALSSIRGTAVKRLVGLL